MTIPNQSAANNRDRSWIPVLEIAAREVFELMLTSKLTAEDASSEEPLGMTAMVGLAGQLRGLLSIQASGQAAALMASKMLDVDPEAAGPEMYDAFGEVCNMVAGNFKNKIPGLGDSCFLSVPTVIAGQDYKLHSPEKASLLQIKLRFEGMPLVISLQVNN